MVVEYTEVKYEEYLRKNDIRWQFGNHILYEMCEKKPLHNDKDVIIGKIWLIGRSYSAAIERRKNKGSNESNEDFYYNKVGPKMVDIGTELDKKICQLKRAKGVIDKNSLQMILSLHKLLVDTFHELTDSNQRSLASKYLHFHCPEMFFIYDSRAQKGVNSIVKGHKEFVEGTYDYDVEYKNFFSKMMELQYFLERKKGIKPSPRQLDDFLLAW